MQHVKKVALIAIALLVTAAGVAFATAPFGLQNGSFEADLDGWEATVRHGVYDTLVPDRPPCSGAGSVCVVTGSDTFQTGSGPVTVTPLDGAKMVRLGGPFTSVGQSQPPGERYTLRQTFVVDPAQPFLALNYNVFTWDYTGYDELRFRVRLTDEAGEPIVDNVQGSFGFGTALKSTCVVLPAACWPSLSGRLAVARLAPRRALAGGFAALSAALALAGAGAAIGAGERLGIEPSGGVAHGRIEQWGDALATFADRPLLGAGTDAYLVASARHQGAAPVRYAHSLPLEAAAELGIAGLALVLALYAATAAALWRARRSRTVWLLGPAAAGFLLAGLVDWPWHLAGSGTLFAVALGAVVTAGRPGQRGSATPAYPGVQMSGGFVDPLP